MYLMLKDTPVLQVDMDHGVFKELHPNLLPVRLRNVFKESPQTLDYKSWAKIQDNNRYAFQKFLSHRVLNLSRKNAKKILNAYDFSQSQDEFTKAEIAVACKAISMIDDYWIKLEDQDLTWDKINLRENPLNEIIAHVALSGSSLTATGSLHTPELTGQGSYAKAWFREEDGVYLYKQSDGHNESKIEAIVSNLLDCFNVNHVKYTMTMMDGYEVCKCKNMSTDDYCIVPAEDIFSYCTRKQLDFQYFAEHKDPEMFYKTCIIDYLISNRDRHMQNWGYYMDNHTGDILGCHPLFDHNNAFDIEDMNDINGGRSQMIPGKTKKEAALFAIKKCNLVCTQAITKDMFLNEQQYLSFMKRAVELGLYQEQKLTIPDKLFNKKKQQFIPVHINKKAAIDNPFIKHNLQLGTKSFIMKNEQDLDSHIAFHSQKINNEQKQHNNKQIIR